MDLAFFLALLIFSAFFSSYETAFYSLERKSSQGMSTHHLLFSLNVILIGNAIVRVLFSELGGYNLEKFLVEHWQFPAAGIHILTIVVLSFILIIFGETLPLNLGMAYPSFIQKGLSWFIYLSSIILWPLAKPLSFFINKMISFLQKKHQTDAKMAMTEEEVRTIIQLSYEREVVNPHEKQLTDAVIALYSQPVSFYMVQRRDILSIDWNAPLSLAWKKLKESLGTKILVRQGNIDNVVGYIALKDIALLDNIESLDRPVSSFEDKIHPHIVIPESKKLIDAIGMLRQNRRALGVVLDEYGGLEGIVTMNQLLEGLLTFDKGSDFKTQDSQSFPKEGSNIESQGDGIIVNALRTTLRSVLEYFEQELEWVPEEEWSVGRLILKKLDRFPQEGEELQIKNLYFRILLMQHHAIQKIFITLVENEEENPAVYYNA